MGIQVFGPLCLILLAACAQTPAEKRESDLKDQLIQTYADQLGGIGAMIESGNLVYNRDAAIPKNLFNDLVDIVTGNHKGHKYCVQFTDAPSKGSCKNCWSVSGGELGKVDCAVRNRAGGSNSVEGGYCHEGKNKQRCPGFKPPTSQGSSGSGQRCDLACMRQDPK